MVVTVGEGVAELALLAVFLELFIGTEPFRLSFYDCTQQVQPMTKTIIIA